MDRHIPERILLAACLLLAPLHTAAVQAAVPKAKGAGASRQGKAGARKTDLNSAGRTELLKLPGITGAYADKIIAGRPYLTKAQLVTHHILPLELYQSIKGKVQAGPVPRVR